MRGLKLLHERKVSCSIESHPPRVRGLKPITPKLGIIDHDAKISHRFERRSIQHPNVVRDDLRSDLIFPTGVGTTPDAVTKATTDYVEGRLRLIMLPVQSHISVRPMLPERHHLLIVRLRLREVSHVLLDTVERRRSMR